ncbi:MAG: ATP-binding cassette domain-containing protein [Bacteroidales bacterium]
MSEEILQGLMQLFAIISKQDEGTTEHQREFVREFLSSQLSNEKVKEYLSLYEEKAGFNEDPGEQKEKKLTSMKDSIRSVAVCRKINKTLTQKQKVVVLIRLFELLKADGLYTEQRMGIINTAATVFNITEEEIELISHFSREDDPFASDSEEVLLIGSMSGQEQTPGALIKHMPMEGLDGLIRMIRVKSVDLFFFRYDGKNEIQLNGRTVHGASIYLLAPGSTMRLPQGTLYYSDVVTRFMSGEQISKVSFNAEDIRFVFPNGAVGLNQTSISEDFGLIGIMGASGSGKTTLLNVLSGIEKPAAGTVKINGVDIHRDPDKAEGLIGYISQDDLLMEDLTIFENLYYNAKLCFKNLNNKEIEALVDKVLNKLGLLERKDIKVGSPMNKKISGGQRKRLNIALELIREPAVLFVDEPTSGLSSRDSENVMDLLKELSRQGKLIFVVIHQPSSDIYKMFDRLILMDTGGYPIYYGNPIEAVMYFKRKTNQINADSGECSACGNVNPETLFNIIEAKEVDDFGNYTSSRIKTPLEWNDLYRTGFDLEKKADVKEPPAKTFFIPGWFRQLGIFIKRDILSKVSNVQYMALTLLEAPLLSFLLVFIIKYTTGENKDYVFRANENIPPYIFMSIIVALFIGLSVSAEEIFRDRKILKREAFLNLSRSSYLVSKLLILFAISAIQTFTFVLIGNAVLGIQAMFLPYWIMLLVVSFSANIMGLNISAAFNSAVTIYILIPLLVIPQMILGGAMFSFDKLNSAIGGGDSNTPVIADFMTSRWAYEALAVTQFSENPYGTLFYELERVESMSNYKQAFYIPEMTKVVDAVRDRLDEPGDSVRALVAADLSLLRNEIAAETRRLPSVAFDRLADLTPERVDEALLDDVEDYLDRLNESYITLYGMISKKKDQVVASVPFGQISDDHSNDFLSDVVKKARSENKIVRDGNRLVQVMDPVYLYPEPGTFSFRAHFLSPVKYIGGTQVSTFWFNTMIIVLFSILLYVTLYFDALKKLLDLFGKLRFR